MYTHSFDAFHYTPAENEIGQIFVVDVTLKVNLEEAGQSDKVIDTVHY
jgi:dihydroneopterin aldolase